MITVISGGTGSAKLVRGLAGVTGDLTVISNVGDNIWVHGLYVCPDIDTVMYALGGILDENRGWGIRGDTFNFLDQMEKYGHPTWFSLGDRDLATHVARTKMLDEGRTLSEVTDVLRSQLSVAAKIIPCTDDPLTTTVATDAGVMHLQEFWVKHRGEPEVTGVSFEGAQSARPNDDALEAIAHSTAIVIAPGNPVSSIGPILAVSGIKTALEEVREKVIAVSPVIGEKAISGPALKYMKSLGIENSPVGVARYLGKPVGNFVISTSDHALSSKITEFGMKVFETDIIMKDKQGEIALARYLLDRLEKS